MNIQNHSNTVRIPESVVKQTTNNFRTMPPVVLSVLTHSAPTKFQDWHYKKYLRERNDAFIV
jgi:hypothetical protein